MLKLLKYNQLTVIEDAGKNKHGKPLWRVKCDCGKEAVKIASAVRTGRTRSCGCLKSAGNRRTHGKHNSPEYVSWMNMRARCNNADHPAFHNYGGRGIKVCERWDDFSSFLEDMGPRPDGLSIDRIDVNGDYEPGNCRWVSRKVQNTNRRDTRNITLDGETMALSEWAENLGLSYGTLYYRFERGMGKRRALQPKVYSRWNPEGTRV